MNTLVQYLVVGAAGFLGAIARLAVARLCERCFPITFPVGTLIVNITGSFLLGWLITFATQRAISDTLRIAIAVGFIGSYTTFSTFMAESHFLFQEGSSIKALTNILISLILGLMAARLGIQLAAR